ncbi:hypothetical protein [Nocardiopsis aegyptia]|uniref:Uncharacterized protein n=1 Tax=Nocardiopsis aegyptia TaxID=220378 RepID=A0A7Z0EPS5_9ACTN|nr:hypothetical protein [Nocardiopsis aegyptia]NYJ36050.1 hypothetical protein [Nocardiopsis aegyptia]
MTGLRGGSRARRRPSCRVRLAVLDANWAMMSTLLDEAFDAEAPPLERIDRFVRGFGGMIALTRERMGSTPDCPVGGLSAELSARGPEMRAHATRILDAWAAHFTGASARPRPVARSIPSSPLRRPPCGSWPTSRERP